MVIRSVAGEQSINDVLRASPEAASAHMLHLENMRKVNGHFISQICQSFLFQKALEDCIRNVSTKTIPDEKKAIFAIHVAQGILIGMHMHEQLLDKKKQGLIK